MISPLDFWSMSPGQVWWLVRAKQKSKDTPDANRNADLYRLLKEAKAKNG